MPYLNRLWAARYSYADDAEVEAIGRTASKRGWYTRDAFLTVTRWKTQRSRSRCEDNDEASVESMTRLALSTPDERIRIEAFTRLRGVAYPTASVLLHFARPGLYPIIDFRALGRGLTAEELEGVLRRYPGTLAEADRPGAHRPARQTVSRNAASSTCRNREPAAVSP
jgi:hypothetical protein